MYYTSTNPRQVPTFLANGETSRYVAYETLQEAITNTPPGKGIYSSSDQGVLDFAEYQNSKGRTIKWTPIE